MKYFLNGEFSSGFSLGPPWDRFNKCGAHYRVLPLLVAPGGGGGFLGGGCFSWLMADFHDALRGFLFRTPVLLAASTTFLRVLALKKHKVSPSLSFSFSFVFCSRQNPHHPRPFRMVFQGRRRIFPLFFRTGYSPVICIAVSQWEPDLPFPLFIRGGTSPGGRRPKGFSL